MVKRELPELTEQQKIKFLELLARMSGDSVFERTLDLSPNEVVQYKKILDIKSPDEARLMATKLKKAFDKKREIDVVAENKKAREAESVANRRLIDLENKKVQERMNRPAKVIDVDAIRKKAAKSQKQLDDALKQVDEPDVKWCLPETSDADVDAFRKDVVYRGYTFCVKKYGATKQQIKFEANRLGLKINWDLVKR